MDFVEFFYESPMVEVKNVLLVTAVLILFSIPLI